MSRINVKQLLLGSTLVILILIPLVVYYFTGSINTQTATNARPTEVVRQIILPTMRPFDTTGFDESNYIQPLENNGKGSIYSPNI